MSTYCFACLLVVCLLSKSFQRCPFRSNMSQQQPVSTYPSLSEYQVQQQDEVVINSHSVEVTPELTIVRDVQRTANDQQVTASSKTTVQAFCCGRNVDLKVDFETCPLINDSDCRSWFRTLDGSALCSDLSPCSRASGSTLRRSASCGSPLSSRRHCTCFLALSCWLDNGTAIGLLIWFTSLSMWVTFIAFCELEF